MVPTTTAHLIVSKFALHLNITLSKSLCVQFRLANKFNWQGKFITLNPGLQVETRHARIQFFADYVIYFIAYQLFYVRLFY